MSVQPQPIGLSKEGGRWRLATDCWNLDAPM